MTGITLNPVEARVLGVLVEKALTTPDQYPLSLNAVTNGSNQKSNRDPVLDLLESEVTLGLQGLTSKNLVYASHSPGSRVEKYRHNGETVLEVDTPKLAILAELLMRGPQQPGELRARVNRMAPLAGIPALMEHLQPLMERGLVQRLAPAPGSRAERYGQAIAPDAHPQAAPSGPITPLSAPAPAATTPAPAPTAAPSAPAASSGTATAEPNAAASNVATADAELVKRVVDLEEEVTRLRRQLRNLAWKLGEKLEG